MDLRENSQTLAGSDAGAPSEDNEPKSSPGGGGSEIFHEDKQKGALELVYGTLFDPVNTFRYVAAHPSLATVVMIFVLINAAEVVMNVVLVGRYLSGVEYSYSMSLHAARALGPVLGVAGFLIGVFKWFVVSGVLHLLAEFFGGRGKAVGVFAVYGLAGLPAIFMIPVQFLLLVAVPAGVFATFLVSLAGLAVLIWSVSLLVLGIREVHGLSTTRAVAVVLTPLGVVLALLLIVAVLFFSIALWQPVPVL